MNKGSTFSSILAVGVALAGCTGMVTGSDGLTGPNNNGSSGSGSAAAGGGTGASAGVGGSAATVPGLSLMHRLNTAEYNATVKDVLLTTKQPGSVNWRGGEVDGFDNLVSALSVDGDQYGLYLDAAEELATDVFASDTLRARVLTCTTTDDMACVTTIINQTGLRLFRRPVLADEVATYTKAYKAARTQGEDHTSSVRHLLWALLSSAQFLYRIEFDNGVATKHPISGYELASRLSYFLWSSAPDDALLAAADQLTTDAAINSTVDRMLSDNKSSRFVTNFAGQWLGARGLPSHAADKNVYAVWTPEVANAAASEVFQYFEEFLRTNRPWTDFLKVDVNFVNGPLAALYGISDVTGADSVRKEYAGDNRAGFLSLVGFLANSSVAARSSPTLRGKWLLVNLLCAPPPPPPKPFKLEDNGAHPETGNVRALLELHRASPACSACHSVMDPFGLALEQYDGIGEFRSAYPDGSAIDPTTELPKSPSFPDGVKFSGLDGAASVVGGDPRFKGCIAQKLYTYGIGRSLSSEDKANAADIAKKWADAGDLSIGKLLHVLALADAFRSRTPAL
jgi:hypothetical protein